MDEQTVGSGRTSGGRRTVPTVSVMIPAYTLERWSLLKKAVESVREQTVAVDTVVLCIDNNPDLLDRARAEWRDSTETPVLVLANRYDEHLSRVKIHQRAHGTTRRFGSGSARNTGAQVITSDIIAFMDDDAWAEPDWIERLLAVYSDTSIVAVGGAPVPDFETSRPDWFPAGFDWVFGCAYDGLPTVTAPLRHLIGANMSVRRSAFEAVGGFHGSDFDDLNLCMRLAAKYGVNGLYYVPDAVVHHFVSGERVSWHYYWRRCYFVNREKVRVFRRMGAAANLAAEREFVWRSLREHSVIDIRRGFSGDTAAFRSFVARLIGIALAGMGNLRGQLDQLGRHRAR